MKKFTMIELIALLVLVAGVAQAAQWRALDSMEQARTGANRVYEMDHNDLTTTTTNTAQTLTVAVKAKQAVQFVFMELETAFDTANTNHTGSLAVTVGDGTDADLYLTSTELASDGTEVWKKFGPVPTVTATATGETSTNLTVTVTSVDMGRKVYTADDTIDFVFTPNAEEAVSANVQGKARFYFNVQ
jgi:hypothetical protein